MGGDDHIYGDNGINVSDAYVDPRLIPADGTISPELAAKLAVIRATYRVLSIPYLDAKVADPDPLVSPDKNNPNLVFTQDHDTLAPGDDTIYGGDAIGTASGNDIIFGDYGVIDQTPGTLRILNLNTPVNIVQVRTVRPADGGVDTIYGGDGSDTVLGGYAGDVIDAGQGDNIVVGDSGSLTYAAGGVLTILTTTDPTLGGDDRITTGAGNDRILAASATTPSTAATVITSSSVITASWITRRAACPPSSRPATSPASVTEPV